MERAHSYMIIPHTGTNEAHLRVGMASYVNDWAENEEDCSTHKAEFLEAICEF